MSKQKAIQLSNKAGLKEDIILVNYEQFSTETEVCFADYVAKKIAEDVTVEVLAKHDKTEKLRQHYIAWATSDKPIPTALSSTLGFEIILGFDSDAHLELATKEDSVLRFLAKCKAYEIRMVGSRRRVQVWCTLTEISASLCSELVWVGRWIEMTAVRAEARKEATK